MESKETLVREWYLKNVNQEELDGQIKATIVYFRRLEPYKSKHTVWAYKLVDGSQGKDTLRVCLDKILYSTQNFYMTEGKKLKQAIIKEEFRELKHLITRVFNETTSLSGSFSVGYHEADRSLGMYYKEYS